MGSNYEPSLGLGANPVYPSIDGPAVEGGTSWSYMLSGQAQPPVGPVTSTDRSRLDAMAATLQEQHLFIETDIQTDLLASIMFPGLEGDIALSTPGAAPVADFDANEASVAGIQPPLPGEIPFRFGHDLNSAFSFTSVSPTILVTGASPQQSSAGSPVQPTPGGVGPAFLPTAGPDMPAASSSSSTIDPALLSSSPCADFMTTPAPSRPSSPPLLGPILGLTSDILKLNHAVRHASSKAAPDPKIPAAASSSEEWKPPASPTGTNPMVSNLLVDKHRNVLLRTIDKALLIGVAGTYNDAEAASEFIIQHPDEALQAPLDELFNDTWSTLSLDPSFDMRGRPIQDVQSNISQRVGSMVANDSRVRLNVQTGQVRIGDFLSDVFGYTFDVLLGKKDGSLLAIKQEGSVELARDKINNIASTMAYAHLPVYVTYESDPPPVTVYSHPEVADFAQLTSVADTRRAVTILHRYKAYKRLVETRNFALQRRNYVWTPNPTQDLILTNPPQHRFSSQTQWLLRVVMPGGHQEVYFLNFQAAFLLYAIRFVLEIIHRKSKKDGESTSVVARYFGQQKNIPPHSPRDTVWRLVILPLAMCASALYVARENIEAYMAGDITAEAAMEATPKVALVFQAKILSAEKVLSDWKASPHSAVEYPLLRHRLLNILSDVVRPGDDYIGYDLVGPVFSAMDPDHLAYDQSFTSRDHVTRRFTEPLMTRAPSILETSYLVSSRSRSSVLSLLKETLV